MFRVHLLEITKSKLLNDQVLQSTRVIKRGMGTHVIREVEKDYTVQFHSKTFGLKPVLLFNITTLKIKASFSLKLT